jgi:hypothetical protein
VYEHDDQNRVIGFRDEEDPDEAEIVREIVRRLIAGDPLRTITEDLNRRAAPAPGAGQRRRHRAKGQAADGSRWNKTSVKKIATRPANVGLRVHHRGRPDEMLIPAAWPALVERDDHDVVVALLASSSRNVAALARPGARAHLLSWGIGECGVCGGHLRVARKGNVRYGTKKLLYLCDGRGCVGRDEERVDLFVSHVAVERLKRPDLVDLLAVDDGAKSTAMKRAEAIRGRLAQAADDYADEKITADQLHRITARLKPELARAELEERSHRADPRVKLVLDVAGEFAEEKWAGMSVQQRHAVLGVLIDRVRILPVTRRGPGFDPTSVEIVWKERVRSVAPIPASSRVVSAGTAA